MLYRLLVLCLTVFFTFPLFSISKSDMKMKVPQLNVKPRMNEIAIETKTNIKTPYLSVIGNYFDKSANGYGWHQSYNRKISWNADPATGPMIGSVYRKLDDLFGSGTIGGMIGDWSGSDLLDSTQTIYDYSTNFYLYPGGRYPYSCGFINGYYFGIFNETNAEAPDRLVSYPMYIIGDATSGYASTSWESGLTSASNGGATVPAAWNGTGDVVYDQATEYYYWTQDFIKFGDYTISTVVGRSKTPLDASSWEWSDYRDLTLDSQNDPHSMTIMNELEFAYCKDIYGNGTGKGIAVTTASYANELDLHVKISYMYTTNWGGDDSSGDWSPNWITDRTKLFQINPADLFDWYGTTYTEVDSISGDSLVTVLDDAWIWWNISSVATENNYVHILMEVIGGNKDIPYYGFYMNDDDFISGYYHVRGLITDSGVVWSPAHLIASQVGLDTREVEEIYMWTNVLSIGYAGFGQIYATWLDRPLNQPIPNGWPEPDTAYWDDGYLSFSCDDGNTWEIPTSEEAPGYGHIEVEFDEDLGHIYNLYYAMNVTNTPALHEEGWSCSSTGKIENGQIEVYAANQYFDAANPLDPPINSFADHEQFLHVWKITGSISDGTGITAEQVNLVNDFELRQNYPNPFNPSTEISFKIQNDANVKLIVFNTKGETVVRLVGGNLEKGLHKVKFDGSKLNSGVYFYQLSVNGMKSTKKMVLAK